MASIGARCNTIETEYLQLPSITQSMKWSATNTSVLCVQVKLYRYTLFRRQRKYSHEWSRECSRLNLDSRKRNMRPSHTISNSLVELSKLTTTTLSWHVPSTLATTDTTLQLSESHSCQFIAKRTKVTIYGSTGKDSGSMRTRSAKVRYRCCQKSWRNSIWRGVIRNFQTRDASSRISLSHCLTQSSHSSKCQSSICRTNSMSINCTRWPKCMKMKRKKKNE